MKKSILLVVLVVFALTSVVLFSQAEAKKSVIFTKEELAKYNGQNGAESYIAIDSIVYNVTNIPSWAGGKHKGIQAGQDVTAFIKKAPHGMKVLAKLLTVGTLVDSTTSSGITSTQTSITAQAVEVTKETK